MAGKKKKNSVSGHSRARSIPQVSTSISAQQEPASFGRSPGGRSVSTARLAASPSAYGTPPVRQIPTPRQIETGDASEEQAPLPGTSMRSLGGPGPSSSTQAFRQSSGRSPPRFSTPPDRPFSPDSRKGDLSSHRRGGSNYGSFDQQQELGKSPGGKFEDVEVLRRHLVGPSHGNSSTNLAGNGEVAGSYKRQSNSREEKGSTEQAPDGEEFSSLQLQGGDTTRHIYRYAEGREREEAEAEERRTGRLKRSLSVNSPRADVEEEDTSNIKKPGGFRRDYLIRTAGSPVPSSTQDRRAYDGGRVVSEPTPKAQPQFLANNFIEFSTLYGHFAGESLDEDDEVLGPDEYFSSDTYSEVVTDGEGRDDGDYGEDSALSTPGKKRRRRKERAGGKGSPGGAASLLLKSFVGTGVSFLPRAFLNGGMLFSNSVLLGIAILSYWCFILLVTTRSKVHASFGDMGGEIYGKHFRNLINFSSVISQIGFASAYIVFVSENLQAFILAVSKCRTFIDIKYMISMQMIVFSPSSSYRNINNIQKSASIADLFIALGLVYLYYYDIATLAHNHGIADIVNFNASSWTLFIGTAIFTFEGIGSIIPIQSGMKNPEKFPTVSASVMVVITVVFISMGASSYAAYGSATKTVIILNMPQDNKLVNGVQFIYSSAILLSTPSQIYPAIEITSQQSFSRTGKYNPWIKWKKNVFRFFMVVSCACIAYAGANDSDKFVALVGSFACVPLVYIYPPLMHYKVISTKTWQKVADLGLCIFGILVMGYTTALTVISWMGPSQPKAPGYCDSR